MFEYFSFENCIEEPRRIFRIRKLRPDIDYRIYIINMGMYKKGLSLPNDVSKIITKYLYNSINNEIHTFDDLRVFRPTTLINIAPSQYDRRILSIDNVRHILSQSLAIDKKDRLKLTNSTTIVKKVPAHVIGREYIFCSFILCLEYMSERVLISDRFCKDADKLYLKLLLDILNGNKLMGDYKSRGQICLELLAEDD